MPAVAPVPFVSVMPRPTISPFLACGHCAAIRSSSWGIQTAPPPTIDRRLGHS